jgi:UDP-glucose 4-epimerase
MRIVVTGASGNLGTALLRRLTATDEHTVTGIARRVPSDSPFSGRVTWQSLDLTAAGAGAALRETMDGADAVVHLAWGFQPSHRLDYLEELGVGGTRRVVRAVTAAGVPHLVHMSSVGAYSPKHDDSKVDESWPTNGVPTSPYSRHKAAAERLLDELEADHPEITVTRMRPGIVGQRAAGSALLRYGLPALAPARLLTLLPVLPLDRGLVMPMVHADDVADAIERALVRRSPGPFNLAADPPVTREVIAEVLGARPVHVPSGVVRGAAAAAWHARLQPVDPGWVDLAFAVPLLDTSRAASELGWTAATDAVTVLRETVEGMRSEVAGPTPVLRRRTVLRQVRDTLLHGPVTSRRQP